MNFHLALLRAASLLVEREQRSAWLAEWSAELWYVRRAAQANATAFCLGAFRDVLWLRRNGLPDPARAMLLASPYRCILLLAAIAAVAFFGALKLPVTPPGPTSPRTVDIVQIVLTFAVLAFLLVPVTTRFYAGEYAASRYAPGGFTRIRRWVFFAAKVALLVVIVPCGCLDLGGVSFLRFLPTGILFAYIFAFRWAIADQRERCPVCLRRLTNPTRIGEASHAFLEWYGTEFICARGHGLLHVPEIPTSCYSASRWQYLDPSWSSLPSAPATRQ
jgi:hypothetical protein